MIDFRRDLKAMHGDPLEGHWVAMLATANQIILLAVACAWNQSRVSWFTSI